MLPYEEFLRIQEELDDYQDLRSLRDEKKAEKDAMTIGMAELKERSGKRKCVPPIRKPPKK